MAIHKVNGKLAIGEFTTLVEPELKDLITRLGEEAKEDWKTFEQKVKEEFRFEDPDPCDVSNIHELGAREGQEVGTSRAAA